jgi:hypothetical protein
LRRGPGGGKERRRVLPARFVRGSLCRLPASHREALEKHRILTARFGQQFLRFLDERRQALLLVSLFLILVGSRAVVVAHAGNPTPYTDEWDGEAANLLKPYLEGALTIGDLFRAHDEHIIVFTRLLTLGVFKASGYWDVILQMIVNAIIDAVTAVA